VKAGRFSTTWARLERSATSSMIADALSLFAAREECRLAETPAKPESDPAADGAAPSRFRALVSRLITVAVTHWKRTVAAALTAVALLMGIGIAWTYMVNLAIDAERAKLDE